MFDRLRKGMLSLLVASAFVAAPLAASADEYDETRAGHPLRIAGYVLHPVGVVIDMLLLKPAHWLGSQEPLATIFGHDTEE